MSLNMPYREVTLPKIHQFDSTSCEGTLAWPKDQSTRFREHPSKIKSSAFHSQRSSQNLRQQPRQVPRTSVDSDLERIPKYPTRTRTTINTRRSRKLSINMSHLMNDAQAVKFFENLAQVVCFFPSHPIFRFCTQTVP